MNRKSRFLEYVCLCLQRALYERQYELVFTWSEEIFQWLAKREKSMRGTSKKGSNSIDIANNVTKSKKQLKPVKYVPYWMTPSTQPDVEKEEQELREIDMNLSLAATALESFAEHWTKFYRFAFKGQNTRFDHDKTVWFTYNEDGILIDPDASLGSLFETAAGVDSPKTATPNAKNSAATSPSSSLKRQGVKLKHIDITCEARIPSNPSIIFRSFDLISAIVNYHTIATTFDAALKAISSVPSLLRPPRMESKDDLPKSLRDLPHDKLALASPPTMSAKSSLQWIQATFRHLNKAAVLAARGEAWLLCISCARHAWNLTSSLSYHLTHIAYCSRHEATFKSGPLLRKLPGATLLSPGGDLQLRPEGSIAALAEQATWRALARQGSLAWNSLAHALLDSLAAAASDGGSWFTADWDEQLTTFKYTHDSTRKYADGFEEGLVPQCLEHQPVVNDLARVFNWRWTKDFLIRSCEILLRAEKFEQLLALAFRVLQLCG
ncbi:hypothetical protein Ciccas_002001 [Cichlidogyrus casuarinus]|uniref:Uncharacterized protein n=1 Tax=Cichlidogyrus casuarinus TaxID=1844966 RepID=A0ABD2QIH0_9PLAT